MNNKINFLLWLLIGILLLPILFFPVSPDSSIYLDSGRIIANGGKLYVDNIDLKQPLIYYVFALVYLLFGYSEITIRLFDYLWQFATIISLFFLVSKSINKKTAYISAILYALFYPTLGYSQSVQCETFVALPLVWMIYFLTFHRKKNIFIFISGLLIGLIAGLKLTFIVIFFAVIIYIFVDKKDRKSQFLSTSILTFGTILGFALSMFPLIDSEIYHGYTLVFKYLLYYSSTEANLIETLKLMIKNTGIILGDRYSMLFTVSMLTGIYYFIKITFGKKKKVRRLLNLSLLLIFFLFLSVVAERKFWDYHYARMFLPMFFFSAVGLIISYKKTMLFYKKGDTYLKALIIAIALCFFILSPASRWLNSARTAYLYFTNSEKYDALFSEYISGVYIPLRSQHKLIAEKINGEIKPDDLVIIVSTGSNAINHFLKTENISAFRNSQFIFNPMKFPEWDYRFSKEIRQADWVVVQTDDSREQVIGEDISSWDMLKKDTDNLNFLIRNFFLFDKVGNFLIFKRNFP